MIATIAETTSVRDGTNGLSLVDVDTSASEAHRRLSERLLQAQDEERRRIARELHDGIGQYLAAMEMSLVGALDSSPALSANAKTALSDCLATVRQCSQEARTMSQLLHPPLLEVVGLAVAVRDYVTGFSKRSSVLVAVEVPEALPRRDRDIETGALRIVQESLMNVYRHSGSRRAVVRVNSHAGNLAVEVEDFGRGIPAGVLKGQVDGEAQPGVGLQGMRCRVEQLGGALQIRSNGRGTVIRAVFPSTKRD